MYAQIYANVLATQLIVFRKHLTIPNEAYLRTFNVEKLKIM
jgi:hypothetical protein